MKIFIMTDLEGVAGVTTFGVDTNSNGKYYERSKSFLTQEVNAAAQACFEKGASEILVADDHGAGAINIDELHEDVQLLHGKNRVIPFGMDRGFDAMFIIGQHAMQGAAAANMHHTMDQDKVISYWLNDIRIGEMGLYAYLGGYFDVPFIYLSGDKAACEEAKAFAPGITVTAVKEGISQTCAISLTPQKARKMIKRDAGIALDNAGKIKALKIQGRVTLKMQFMSSDIVSQYALKKGVQVIDPLTVSYTAENVFDACKIWY